jgi:hypothetical protein
LIEAALYIWASEDITPPDKQTELNTKYANYVNKPPKIKEAELWWASNEFMNDFMPTSADQLAFNAKYQGDERIF